MSNHSMLFELYFRTGLDQVNFELYEVNVEPDHVHVELDEEIVEIDQMSYVEQLPFEFNWWCLNFIFEQG
jgi:REP element-mobilizing transposase RayT